MKYGSKQDPYLDKNGVLRNKLGAKNEQELELAENIFVLRKLALLLQAPITGRFDLKHLKAIHRYLFEDVYSWSGKLRSVAISKGDSMFAHPLRIEIEAIKLFEKLKSENYLLGLDQQTIVKRLAFYLGELNILHPFREGNGRTQRAFLILLARNAGYNLHFGQLDVDLNIEASIRANICDYSLLEKIIADRIQPLDTL
ncbi:hypothetical protein A1D22_01555 [Pasteurellaceae bacterium LFhippo2]|nr:hypothetical protein [Pasteurellaceae bacterium LFhippo2]